MFQPMDSSTVIGNAETANGSNAFARQVAEQNFGIFPGLAIDDRLERRSDRLEEHLIQTMVCFHCELGTRLSVPDGNCSSFSKTPERTTRSSNKVLSDSAVTEQWNNNTFLSRLPMQLSLLLGSLEKLERRLACGRNNSSDKKQLNPTNFIIVPLRVFVFAVLFF